MNTKPLLLGHHSEKVIELWDKVNRKEILSTHDFSKGFIYSIINSTLKYHSDRVTELTKDLAIFRRISRPVYQFLPRQEN